MTKRFVLLFLIIIVTLGAVSYFLIKKGTLLLISPLALGRDQTEKISQRISPDFHLTFSKTKELAPLTNVPRYMVYNQDTSVVYYAKGTEVRMSPASFTKLLSTQIVLDLVSTTSSIVISEKSINKVPTILGLKAGEKITVADLLRGAIATSANDAAQALADGASDYVSIFPAEFIYYMNTKADLLGMKHSHFVNPDGLDDQNQYSTLEDVARLINNVQKNYPDILAAAKSDNQDIEETDTHGRYYLPNWNGLLGVYPGVTGLKIAYTEEAGYSTIVTAKRNNFSMVALVSGTSSYLERDRAAADLLDAAFLAEGLAPVKVTTSQLNHHYKIWGDLARKIRAESNQTSLKK